eukprot:2446404-Prymnesium_polylepis.1
MLNLVEDFDEERKPYIVRMADKIWLDDESLLDNPCLTRLWRDDDHRRRMINYAMPLWMYFLILMLAGVALLARSSSGADASFKNGLLLRNVSAFILLSSLLSRALRRHLTD